MARLGSVGSRKPCGSQEAVGGRGLRSPVTEGSVCGGQGTRNTLWWPWMGMKMLRNSGAAQHLCQRPGRWESAVGSVTVGMGWGCPRPCSELPVFLLGSLRTGLLLLPAPTSKSASEPCTGRLQNKVLLVSLREAPPGGAKMSWGEDDCHRVLQVHRPNGAALKQFPSC